MTNTLSWIYDKYAELSAKYGGKYVLITEEGIAFADENPELVYEKYKILKKSVHCKIALIDSGEATIYVIKTSSK